MKAFKIDVTAKSVTEIEYGGLSDLQTAVGGSICLAGHINGDTVYVNDEGLFLFHDYFDLPGCGQGLFAGNGIIVGREIGQTANTRDPRSPLAKLRQAIKFYGAQEARRIAYERGI